MVISGLGPHGERAASPERIALGPNDIEAAKQARFEVAIVLHTLASDWSKQQLSGIVGALGECATVVTEVVDCGFEYDAQIAALEALTEKQPDAVISIPVGNAAVADAHKKLAASGVKLILLDNVPTGLLPGSDYSSLVSADNFGLGQIGAELLSPFVGDGSAVGVLAYGVDFFAANEREIAFVKWMQRHRRDVELKTARFDSLQDAGKAAVDLVSKHQNLGGLFVVWDQPAMAAVSAVRKQGFTLPITTVDLGREVAAELARGGMIKGVGAQQPHMQGIAVAQTTILALLDKDTPQWVALPGLPVTRTNVLDSFQAVWRSPAPDELIRAARQHDE